MSKEAEAQSGHVGSVRPIGQLREAAKLLTGRVARAYCGRSWTALRQLLLTQASKTPHRAYLDTELLNAAAPELDRLTRELDTGLLRYEASPDEGQLARLEVAVAHLALYLIRIFRLGALPSVRAGHPHLSWEPGRPPEEWVNAMHQALAHDAALREELSDLGMVLLRVLAAEEDQRASVRAVLEDRPEASVAHKLKLKIPLIPLFLDYEGEIELGTKLDLRPLWTRLVAWLRGEPGGIRGQTDDE